MRLELQRFRLSSIVEEMMSRWRSQMLHNNGLVIVWLAGLTSAQIAGCCPIMSFLPEPTAHQIIGSEPVGKAVAIDIRFAEEPVGVCIEGTPGTSYEVQFDSGTHVKTSKCEASATCSFAETCRLGTRSRAASASVECRGPTPAKCVVFFAKD